MPCSADSSLHACGGSCCARLVFRVPGDEDFFIVFLCSRPYDCVTFFGSHMIFTGIIRKITNLSLSYLILSFLSSSMWLRLFLRRLIFY